MSVILYYSNYCKNSQTLLQTLAQSSIKDDMHFICIDKRVKKQNGATYIILENGQELLLSPSVTKVPALLLLNRGHQVLFGEQIKEYINSKNVNIQKNSTNNNGEPLAFSLLGGGGGGGGCFGVSSDNFSFLDQGAEELSAEGDGGMRQQHHYATIQDNYNIETPPDTYSPDKVGSETLEKIQQQRNNEIKMKR